MNGRDSYRFADDLMARVEAGTNGVVANDLLGEFFHGYPLENLIRLLRSDNVETVKTGTWIASEIAADVAPILDVVVELLNHQSRYVRFFAMETVLVAARHDDGDAIATVLGMIDDLDDAVKAQWIKFASKASVDQLEAGVSKLEHGRLANMVRWLVTCDSAADVSDSISEKLEDGDVWEQKFGCSAAIRRTDILNLRRASESTDPVVASCAQESLDMLSA